MYSVYTSLNMQICIYIFTTLPRDHEYSLFLCAHSKLKTCFIPTVFVFVFVFVLFNPSTNQPSKKSHIIFNANQKGIKIGTRTKHIHKERKERDLWTTTTTADESEQSWVIVIVIVSHTYIYS